MARIVKGVPTEGNPCELIVSGEIDIAVADDLANAALACFKLDTPGVVIDLSPVTFLDASGLGALLRIRDASIAAEKVFILANIPPRVTRVLVITNLDAAFDTDNAFSSRVLGESSGPTANVGN